MTVRNNLLWNGAVGGGETILTMSLQACVIVIYQEAHQEAGIWHQAIETILLNQSSLCLDVSL
jgi:hypothetical protein